MAVDLAEDVLDDSPLVAVRERIAAHEPLREANRANLEAARKLQGGRRSERNFDAATADVDNHGASSADIDAIHGGLMNQPCLFNA